MVQIIAIAVLLLGLVLLLIGLWGRGWRRSGVFFMQPGTRLLLMLVGALLIFGGYWYYFDSPANGRRSDTRVWTSSGVENRKVERDADAVVSAESEVPAEPVQGDKTGDLANQAEQAQAEQAAAPQAPDASPAPVTSMPVEAAPVAATPSAAELPKTASVTAAVATSDRSREMTSERTAVPESEAPPVSATTSVTRSVTRETARTSPAEIVTEKTAPVRRSGTRRRHDDGTVDVCAVQVQYGVVPPVHGYKTATGRSAGATRTVTIRNSLGPGQRSEKLRLLIDGREVAKLDVSRSRPDVSVKLKVPRDREVSYSLVGHTEYAGYSRQPVSGGGYFLDHEKVYDVRLGNPWDIRGGDLFLEPES